MAAASRSRQAHSSSQGMLGDLTAVGTKMQEKLGGSKPSRTSSTPSLPPTRSSASSNNFGATRESTASTTFRTTRASTFLATLPPSRESAASTGSLLIATRSFEPAQNLLTAESSTLPSTLPPPRGPSSERSPSPAVSGRLPKLRPSPGIAPAPRDTGVLEGIVGSRVKRHSVDERARRLSRSDGFGQTILPPDYERPGSGEKEKLPSLPPGFSRPVTPDANMRGVLDDLQDEESSMFHLDGRRVRGPGNEKMLKVVPLAAWLQELGLLGSSPALAAARLRAQRSEGDLQTLGATELGDLSGMLVRGKASFNRFATDPLPASAQKRARLDRAFVEHLARIAQERDLRPIGDMTDELQIFRLKLHDRQARRRLHDIFGARRKPRVVPEPVFANVVAEEEVEPPKPKVKEAPRQRGFDDVVIPSKPKPAPVEQPIVQEIVTPAAVVVTTPTARKPWTPKQKEEEEEPEAPKPVVEAPVEEPEEPEPEVEKPRPRPPTYVPQPQEKKEARKPAAARVEVVTEPTPVPEVVIEPRGLFRVKDEAPDLGMAFYSSPLLFPPLKEEKRGRSSKSRGRSADFEEERPPTSEGEGFSTRPPSQPRRKRFNLAQEFREAISLAWERALAEVEAAWAAGPVEATALERIAKQLNEEGEEFPQGESFVETCAGDSRSPEAEEDSDLEDGPEDMENKESLEQFSSVFARRSNSVCSQESSSLAESVKRVQRRRYARRLERRTGNSALQRRTQRCWTQRVEVCRRLLVSVDRLKGSSPTC